MRLDYSSTIEWGSTWRPRTPFYRCFGPVLVVFGPVLGPPIGPTTTFSTSWTVFDTLESKFQALSHRKRNR
jgi:hypothetical protein